MCVLGYAVTMCAHQSLTFESMSLILALDASADACSVALSLPNGSTLTRVSHEPRAHATYLLPFVESVLQEADLSLSQLDAIACAVGPGSFTGLRIALSTAQGLAFSVQKNIIPVNSLAAMVESVTVQESVANQKPAAEHCAEQYEDNNRLTYLPIMDARMNEIYWGHYASALSPLSQKTALVSGEKDFVAALSEIDQDNILLVGDAWLRVPFAQSAAQALELVPISTQSDAGSVLRLAMQHFAAGHKGENPSKVDLCYCRNSVAWDKRQPIRPR